MDIHAENTDEAGIRAAITSWQKAVGAADLDAIMAHYAPDVIAYDAILSLQFKGIDAYRKHWEFCIAMCGGSMTFHVQDLHILTGGDIAHSHCLNQCGGVDKEGNTQSSWMRNSTAYCRIDGRWLIAHEHFSAPFDPESFKALFDLQP